MANHIAVMLLLVAADERDWDGSRADIVLSEHVIEVDWSRKWAEGIGQALLYAKLTNKRPVLLLLVKSDSYPRYVTRALIARPPRLTVWVFDTRTKSWIFGPVR